MADGVPGIPAQPRGSAYHARARGIGPSKARQRDKSAGPENYLTPSGLFQSIP